VGITAVSVGGTNVGTGVGAGADGAQEINTKNSRKENVSSKEAVRNMSRIVLPSQRFVNYEGVNYLDKTYQIY
jgi:hypothetical protein